MLLAYLKRQYKLLLLLAGAVCIFAAVFALYDLPLEAVLYAGALCLALGLVLFAVGYSRFLRRHRELQRLLRQAGEKALSLPPARGLLEEDYQTLLQAVCRDRARLAAENESRLRELTDYYSLWVHQIKTPIAAMDLLLQEDDSPRRGELEMELLKIGQYVEMVLGYLRTEDMASDIRFEEMDMDSLIREQIHKFARIFIGKKLSLEYQEVSETVLTDEKWLGFVIEQLLSNALKYTHEGSITIGMEEGRLTITDTGIGIRAEDLPRVCEKGYTGYNGHANQKSTGIGLYLCSTILKKLGHSFTITSQEGTGTRVMIGFPEES